MPSNIATRPSIQAGIVKILSTICLLLVFSAPSWAIEGPGWIGPRGEEITPQDARKYYQSLTAPISKERATSVRSSALSLAPGDAAVATSEIQELARGLQHDPKLIYEYVRNHVDYVPYFGSLKGATLTYLDGAGNDFDQASLMIALLRESGYTAQYVYGQMSIPTSDPSGQNDLQHWLGVDANAAVIARVLHDGGIPAANNTSSWSVDRVWVQADISGVTCVFDPAFKAYRKTQGIDLTSATGYSRSSLLTSAGGTAGASYVRSLNEANVRTALNGYTMNLVEYIRANYPNASTEEVVGGRSIVPQYLSSLSTGLGFTVSPQSTWTAIPEVYAHKVRIQHGQIDETFNIADLAGRRLALTYINPQGVAAASQMEIEAKKQALMVTDQTQVTELTLTSGAVVEQPEPLSPVPTIKGTEDVKKSAALAAASTIDFGRVSPNGYKFCNMSYTNSGTMDHFVVASVRSASGAYSVEFPNSANLKPGQTFSYKVRFSGSGQTPGVKTGTLKVEVAFNPGPNPGFVEYNYNLTGIVAQPLNLDGYGASMTTFLNQPVVGTCRLQNKGTLPLTINSMSLAGANPGRFQFVSGNGSGTVAAGGSRDIRVRYLANAVGTHTANITLSLTYDGVDYTSTLPLQGHTGATPNLTGSYGYNAGQRYLNDYVDGICRLKNSGSLNLTITGISLTGTNAARFSILSGGETGTLSAGQYRDIAVRYPANSLGTHTANVHIVFAYDGVQTATDLPLAGETKPQPVAQLWLDDDLIVGEVAPVTGTNLGKMTLTINHPYAAKNGTYADQTMDYDLKRGSTYAIVYDFYGSRQGRLLEKCQRRLQAYRESGLGDSSRQVLTETLNVAGMSWMRDTTLNDELFCKIAEVVRTPHHRFGVAAQEAGYYIDVKADVCSYVSIHGDTAAADAYFRAKHYLDSALEHGILEQMQVDRPAVSTVKLLQLANAQGTTVYKVNVENFASIQPLLTGYSSQQLSFLQNRVNYGSTLILPQNGQIASQEWSGLAYIEYSFTTNLSYMGMMIGGGYHGGYGGYEMCIDVEQICFESELDMSFEYTTPIVPAIEPVDMVSGAWTYDNVDLALTGGVGGLSLKRAYNSMNNSLQNALGYGWSHNYDLYAEVHSSGEFGLGRRTPIDAAALITASVVTLDLMSGNPDVKTWMTGALIGKWAMDQLNDNAVSVHLETDVLTFIKLPDGSFALPPGVTSQLVKEGGLYRINERFGRAVAFNSANQVSLITDADGNRITFTYSNGKLQTVADGFGHSLTFTYTGERLTSVRDSAARTVSYSYNAGNLVTFTDAEGQVWTYGYDGHHRVLTLQDPMAVTTITNVYDSLGRVKTQTAPRQNGTATYNLYFSGYRNVEEDSQGSLTVYHFDEHKRLIAQEDALGNKTVKVYDGQNHMIAQTDPRNNTTTYEYDGDHNLIKTTDALANETVNTYDSQFRLTDATDPLGHTVHHDYDAEHHPVRTVTYPAQGQAIEVSKTYYPNGLVNTSRDGRGVVTTFTYDNHGNPNTTKTGAAPAIDYNYDTIGRLSALSDQAGALTTFLYDDRGLLLSRTDPLLKTANLTYYDDGKLHTSTDRNNATTTYAYTPAGKPATVTYQDGATVSFTYDQHDNQIGMQDSLGTSTYAYDQVKRLTSATDANGFTVSYGYDQAGNLIRLTYPDNRIVRYTYDALNRLESVTIDWLARTAYYQYDDAGRLTGLTQFNGTVTALTYDNANRLIALENRAAPTGAIIATYHFTLDANGNRTHVEHQAPLTPIVDAMDLALSYNNQRNRLLTAGTTSFNYDDEGQLSAKAQAAYTFDSAYRLTRISGAGDDQFFYDGANRRLEARRNGTVTRYIHDAAGNLLAEADGSGAITRYYIHGAGLLALATPAGALYCYHFDATGHTVALTDSSRTVVNRYAYTPFGNANQVEAIAQPFKYVGQYGIMTEPNGLYYMRARYYDPQVGRFISEDPAGFDGGDVNLYAYVQNNPINRIDPLGLFDIFFGVEGDLVGIVGIEGGFGIVIDTDNWSDSGVFGTIGPAGGANVGIGVGGGVVKEIEGWSYGLDVNAGPASVSIIGDNSGFNGIGVSVGPGVGMSASATYTGTYTLGNLANWITGTDPCK